MFPTNAFRFYAFSSHFVALKFEFIITLKQRKSIFIDNKFV